MTPGFPSPNGASRRSSAQRSSVSSWPGTTASTFVTERRSSSRELGVGVGGERLGERVDVLGPDREAGRGAMAAEALEMLGAGGEAAVQVEGAGRAAGPLPVVPGAGDQDDGPVEALDEPRGDDADHALVPALVGEHVAAPRAACASGHSSTLASASRRIRSSTPCRSRFSSSSSCASRPASSRVLGEQQLERGIGPAQAAGGVDPRREPEADRALVDRAGSTRATLISARRPGFCVRASARRPASASARFSSTSGTTSEIVASATRSRWRASSSLSGPSSASPSL